MDIQGSQPNDRTQKAFEARQRALIDANRALVRAAREHLTTAAKEHATEAGAESRPDTRRDEIRLSDAARAASEPDSGEREAKVRELGEAHRMQRLHTPERLERAAQRLLEG